MTVRPDANTAIEEPRYNPDMLDVEKVTDGPIGEGTRFRALHRGIRRPVEMITEITTYERPSRLAITCEMGWADVAGTLTFEQVPAGTHMRWSWDVRPKGVHRMLRPLLPRLTRREEAAVWAGLKRLLEQQGAEGPTPIHHRATEAGMTRAMNYERTIDVDLPYADAVARTREALTEQGFGVLTEIDVQATLKQKRGVDMEPYVILGACNPELAHQALDIDRSIGVLLPCNVVVSGRERGSTIRILDPLIMSGVTGRAELEPLAQEAARRLGVVLESLASG
jgi:uncharacterized protein (DUF302 family)